MKRAVIVHGWEGHPEEGWFPWLKKELEKKGFSVDVPAMPTPNFPRIETWVPYLAKVVGNPDEEMWLIGHSVGCQTILRYLESINTKVGGVVLVGCWLRLSYPPNYEVTEKDREIDLPWQETPLDFSKIRKNANKFVGIFSDNDSWVPLKNADVLKERLGAEIIIEHNKGHFSGPDGVTELPSALEAIIGPEK